MRLKHVIARIEMQLIKLYQMEEEEDDIDRAFVKEPIKAVEEILEELYKMHTEMVEAYGR